MKYAETLPGLLVLAARLCFVPVARWGLDWIVVLSLFWVAIVLTRPESRPRRWAVVVACAWLAAIYANFQAGFTLAGWN